MFSDDKTVHECGLQEGDKLYAVIKKDALSTPSPTCARIADTSPLYRQLNTLLMKHFREQDAEKVLVEFQKVSVSVANVVRCLLDFCCCFTS